MYLERKIEGERRREGGQVRDHPMRRDLKAGVGFYEFGLSVAHVHAYTDACTDTGGDSETKAFLIQATLAFLPFKVPGLRSEGGAGIIFSLS